MRRSGAVLLNLVLVVTCWIGYCQTAEVVRPMYIIGHMCNTRSTVDEMLGKGANAIEADLSFSPITGLATRFFHGIPCDCFRSCTEQEPTASLLGYMRDISTPGHANFKSGFSGLFWVDLKLDEVSNLQGSGENFAAILINTFKTKGSKLKLVLGVMHPNQFKFIKGCVEELRRLNRTDILARIGAAGSQKDHFSAYIAANKELGLPRLWIDEGSSNCFSHFFKLTELKEAIKERDEGNDVSKVVRWTIDTKAHMRNALSVGTDSIITNDPEDVIEVIQEPEFSPIFRLATSADDPFEKVQGHGPYRLGCYYKTSFWTPWTGTYKCWKDTNISGDWCYTSRNCENERSSCRITDPCE